MIEGPLFQRLQLLEFVFACSTLPKDEHRRQSQKKAFSPRMVWVSYISPSVGMTTSKRGRARSPPSYLHRVEGNLQLRNISQHQCKSVARRFPSKRCDLLLLLHRFDRDQWLPHTEDLEVVVLITSERRARGVSCSQRYQKDTYQTYHFIVFIRQLTGASASEECPSILSRPYPRIIQSGA